jgi:hypothetical protein
LIKNLNSYDPDYIGVTGSYASPYISPGSAGAGMIRWNSNMNQMEVNDGNSWQVIPSGEGSVMLGPRAKEIFKWAEDKMAEEAKLKAMMEQYPALKKAKDNFDMLLNLTKDDYEASK